jgi:hypothetical protein
MKQNCPKCNTNLVYYDLDKRLEADHIQAMKEQEAVDKVLNNIKTSAFGGPLQIIRFVLMFSPLAWMCLPTFRANDGENITLISVIIGIINGNFPFDNPSYLFPFITMVCIILFSLMLIISSLFSMGKKSLSRNETFSIINSLVFVIISIIACKIGEAHLSTGWFLVSITYIIEMELHTLVDKKLNK